MEAKLILLKKKYFVIRLTDNGKRNYTPINTPFTKKEWQLDSKKRINKLKPVRTNAPQYKQYKQNKDWIEAREAKYIDAINQLYALGREFSLTTVVDGVNKPVIKNIFPTAVFKAFKWRVDQLKANEKYGNADNYNGTLIKLVKHFNRDMLFAEMTTAKVESFKKSMDELKPATQSIHLRNLRAIFNLAIEEGAITKAVYPFKKKLFTGLEFTHNSRTLTHAEFNQIRAYRKQLVVGTDVWHACNYFIFGCVGRGINFQDVARLKLTDINKGRIEYVRRKTREKVSTVKSFPVTDELAEIINYYKVNFRNITDPYIFPILNETHITEAKRHNRIRKVRKEVNSLLNHIKDVIGLDIEALTTYTARHTWATVAYHNGVDVSLISEEMHNGNLATTRAYLKQYPDEVKDKAFAFI